MALWEMSTGPGWERGSANFQKDMLDAKLFQAKEPKILQPNTAWCVKKNTVTLPGSRALHSKSTGTIWYLIWAQQSFALHEGQQATAREQRGGESVIQKVALSLPSTEKCYSVTETPRRFLLRHQDFLQENSLSKSLLPR